MKRASIVLLMAGLCLCLACGTTLGNKAIINQKITDQIIVGQSTKADVRELLGEPTHVTLTDTGDEQWRYIYLWSSAEFEFTTSFNNKGIVKTIKKGRTTPGR